MQEIVRITSTYGSHGPNAIADSFRTVRKNTIRIAEDIPETAYGYRPTPENRSVAETLGHIAIASRVDLLLNGDKRLAGNLRFRGVDQAVPGSRRAPTLEERNSQFTEDRGRTVV